MKQPLTDKQLEVLAFMRTFFRENDMLPPITEICVALGGISTSTVSHFQRALVQKGYIEKNVVGKFRFTREGAPA